MFILLVIPGRAYPDDMENSLVRVMVTSQGFDAFMPWQKTDPAVRQGYGYLIGTNRVLTIAQLVRNHTLIELQESLSGEKYTATVELSDKDANLAVLKIADSARMPRLVPLGLAEKVLKDSPVQIVQFNDTDGISRSSGTIVEISVADLPAGLGGVLAFTALADMNVNGQGAVVLHSNKVAGLIMWYDHNTRMGTLLPYPVLRHFIDDMAQPVYRGFAGAGFSWAPLVDPAERRYLKVDRLPGGIVVLKVRSGTGAAKSLLPQDVILEWDNCAVDKLGFYKDSEFGRLAFPYLIKGHRYPGDLVNAKIVRNGEIKAVSVEMTRRTDDQLLIPDNTSGEQAAYLADGGFLIRELTGDYLRAYGEGWNSSADARLVHLYLTSADKPERPGDRVVIMSHVLPDPINVSYQHLRDQVITHINGDPVRNIDDVFTLVERDKGLRSFRLLSMSIDIILDQATLEEANKRIMRTYQIPHLRFKQTAKASEEDDTKPGKK
ncbi:MAG: trypsin-like peptidase domain-containing protein [bacterium]